MLEPYPLSLITRHSMRWASTFLLFYTYSTFILIYLSSYQAALVLHLMLFSSSPQLLLSSTLPLSLSVDLPLLMSSIFYYCCSCPPPSLFSARIPLLSPPHAIPHTPPHSPQSHTTLPFPLSPHTIISPR